MIGIRLFLGAIVLLVVIIGPGYMVYRFFLFLRRYIILDEKTRKRYQEYPIHGVHPSVGQTMAYEFVFNFSVRAVWVLVFSCLLLYIGEVHLGGIYSDLIEWLVGFLPGG